MGSPWSAVQEQEPQGAANKRVATVRIFNDPVWSYPREWAGWRIGSADLRGEVAGVVHTDVLEFTDVPSLQQAVQARVSADHSLAACKSFEILRFTPGAYHAKEFKGAPLKRKTRQKYEDGSWTWHAVEMVCRR